MRAAFGDAGDETGKAYPCFCRHRITLDRNPGRLQPVKALSCGARIRVCQRADDTRGLGGDQRIGASRPAGALMRARLQANIESRTGRFCSGLLQRHCLGVRSAAGMGPAAPDDDVVFNDNAANRRIISSLPLAAFGKRDCGGEPAPVFSRDRYFEAPTRAAISASALARRSASSFCASASSVSTSIPTTLPSAL